MKGEYIALIVAGSALAVALAALFVWFSNSALKVTRYKVKSPKINKKLKIVHLSDLHAKSFGRDNIRLLKRVEEQSPDFIAFTGDIIHKYRPRDISVAVNTASALARIAPVYYVSGNHEMRSKKYRALKQQLQSAGVTVLDNENVQNFGINIIGVNCAHLKNETLFKAAEGVRGFRLLLAHLPQHIARYSLAGYDLALCGHAHGGQWRIPFTRVGIYSPGQGLFPEYSGEMHTCGNMSMVISRGLGNSECPLRLFNRPEIVVVELSD